MLLGKTEEERLVFFFICEGTEACVEGLRGAGDLSGRRDACLHEGTAMREVNLIIYRQEHVDWAGQGLSSTGAPGLPAQRRTLTRCGASPPDPIQSALQLPRC